MPSKKRPFSQDFSGESKTQQHFKDSCDVNNIVATFQATGIDPYADRIRNQKFGFANSQDFSEAMQNIAEINSRFAGLPSEIRQEFSNDPARWIDSLANPSQPDEKIVETDASEGVSDPPDPAPEKPKSEAD